MIYTAVITEPDLIDQTLEGCMLALYMDQNPIDTRAVAEMTSPRWAAYMTQHGEDDPHLTAAVIDGAEPYTAEGGRVIECPVYVVVAVTDSIQEGEGPTIAHL
jgi:hypothetical protein